MAESADRSKEKAIIDLLLARNERGVEILFRDYGGALYHIIFQLVKVEEVAQEVLQDVLLKVWGNIETYDASKSRFFTWMARIAKNASIDKVRSKKYKQRNKTDGLENIVGNSKAPSDSIRTDQIGLKKVLDHLDEDHRVIIDLLYFHEYTQTEVEKELNIPLGTVKTRARRAIQQLREFLKGDAGYLGLVLLILYFLYSSN